MIESNTKTAIVTAVLTGIFTVSAGVLTYWITNKEPELTFTVVGGPTLAATSGTKQIFVVEVRNSGKKEISQTYVQLTLNSGELSEVATEASPGVRLAEDKDQKQIALTADLLNPGDSVKVSFLTMLSLPGTEPRVTVRAPGVQAIDISKRKDGLLLGEESFFQLTAPAFASVLGSFLLLSRRSRSSISNALNELHQSELAAFVCGSCQLLDEADCLRFGGSKVTYRGTADYLLHRAKLNPADQFKYLIALKALLLIKNLADSSVKAIRYSVEEINGSTITDSEFNQLQELAIDEGNNPITWRTVVMTYVKAELAQSNPVPK